MYESVVPEAIRMLVLGLAEPSFYGAPAELKREIHAALTQRFDIHFACDDNPNVVRLWNEVGIPVKVIPGWSD